VPKLLVRKGLLGNGLVTLPSNLVERYNRCLKRAGLTETRRRTIQVDGAGWSPQVARDLGDVHYLCHGVENPLAIIVTPEQFKKPVFFQIFSWVRPLMRAFFEKYHREIIDITATHAILIDLENGLTSMEKPLDLLMLSEINAVPDCGTLNGAGKEQDRLIAQFNEGLNCLRWAVCDELVEHRRQFGDLRRRRIAIDPITFSSFTDFYTIAFNGAAVLRNVGKDDMLVFEDVAVYEQALQDLPKHAGVKIFHVSEPGAKHLKLLEREGWIDVPVDKFKMAPQVLEDKKALLLASALCDCEQDVNWDELSSMQRKGLVKKYPELVPAIFSELERYAAALRNDKKIPELSDELRFFLSEPAEKLPKKTKEVVWTLLTRQEKRNLLEFYTVDKNRFLADYERWKPQRQEWAAGYLAARYQFAMNQP
jgi:hypothetical protein